MKTKLIIISATLITVYSLARVIVPFIGWDRVKESVSDIVVVRCKNPIQPQGTINGPNFEAEIEIVSFLKGTNVSRTARLETDHWLWHGEMYLILGYNHGGTYVAYEDYRVIPLGDRFSTNSIAGKPLDEQIKLLFKQRLTNLNRELAEGEAEKKRLEEGLK